MREPRERSRGRRAREKVSIGNRNPICLKGKLSRKRKKLSRHFPLPPPQVQRRHDQRRRKKKPLEDKGQEREIKLATKFPFPPLFKRETTSFSAKPLNSTVVKEKKQLKWHPIKTYPRRPAHGEECPPKKEKVLALQQMVWLFRIPSYPNFLCVILLKPWMQREDSNSSYSHRRPDGPPKFFLGGKRVYPSLWLFNRSLWKARGNLKLHGRSCGICGI